MKKFFRKLRMSMKVILLCVVLLFVAIIVLISLYLTQREQFSAVKLYDEGRVQEGYTLIAPPNSKDIYLVDSNGNKVHAWKTNAYAGVVTKLLDDGSLLRTYVPETKYFSMGGAGGGIQIIDWNGNVTWDYQYNSAESAMHHDATMMPNGNILALAWDKVPEEEALAAGVSPENIDSKSKSVWSDRVIEINPETNQVVWQWDAMDHLIQDVDPSKQNYGSVSQSAEKVNANYFEYSKKPDWLHMNSVAYDPQKDQIMLSVREFNELWVIDHSTTTAEATTSSGGRSGMGGDLLYRYGNPAAYDHGDESDRTLFLQHDVHWIADGLPGAGNVLLFDNGDKNQNRAYSSAIELDLPDTDAIYQKSESGEYQPAEIVWQYGIRTGSESIFSNIMGGAQRLPNGNTILTDAVHGRVVEVTSDKKRVWDYTNPFYETNLMKQDEKTNSLFRAYKYSADSNALRNKL